MTTAIAARSYSCDVGVRCTAVAVPKYCLGCLPAGSFLKHVPLRPVHLVSHRQGHSELLRRWPISTPGSQEHAQRCRACAYGQHDRESCLGNLQQRRVSSAASWPARSTTFFGSHRVRCRSEAPISKPYQSLLFKISLLYSIRNKFHAFAFPGGLAATFERNSSLLPAVHSSEALYCTWSLKEHPSNLELIRISNLTYDQC